MEFISSSLLTTLVVFLVFFIIFNSIEEVSDNPGKFTVSVSYRMFSSSSCKFERRFDDDSEL